MLMNICWIELDTPGRLALMPRPRGGDWLADDLEQLRAEGAHLLVSLLEPAEARELELEQESAACAAAGLEFRALPIRDRDVPPSQRRVQELAAELAAQLRAGQNVIVHCRGGIGRSGLLAASVMVLLGAEVDDALSRLSAARGCEVPETPAQVEWVRRFAAVVADHSHSET